MEYNNKIHHATTSQNFSILIKFQNRPGYVDKVYHTRIGQRLCQHTMEEHIQNKTVKNCVNCVAKQYNEIYISSVGDVYPCCYLGLEPKTYGKGKYHQAANSQFKTWLTRNNALKYTIDECIEWFNHVEDSWNKQSYEEGRLVICDDVCGK